VSVDKQTMLEHLLNERKITTTEAIGLAELSEEELTPFYERRIPKEDRLEESDDDPQCVCGVWESEHRAMGCGNFQRRVQWEVEKAFIQSLDDDQFDAIYHPDGY
jgi:hypothetical protein